MYILTELLIGIQTITFQWFTIGLFSKYIKNVNICCEIPLRQMDTLSGEAALLLSCLPLFQVRVNSKQERICSPRNNFFPFDPTALRRAKILWSFGPSECKRVKIDPILEGCHHKSHQICPFLKQAEKHEGVPKWSY